MKWIRVKLPDYKEYALPAVCPNCLGGKMSGGFLQISRSVTMPLFGTATYSVQWPHCDDCIDLETYKSKRGRNAAWLALGLLIVLAASAFGIGRLVEGVPVWLWLTPAVIWTMGIIILVVRKNGLVRSYGNVAQRVTSRNAIRIQRGGEKAFSKSRFLDLSFLNPVYAEQFIRLNEGTIEVTYNPKRLAKAIAGFRIERPDPKAEPGRTEI